MTHKPWRRDGNHIIRGEHIVLSAPGIHPDSHKATLDLAVRAVNAHDALLDALTLALPYVEMAELDDAYQPGAVAKMVKQMRAAITKAGE